MMPQTDVVVEQVKEKWAASVPDIPVAQSQVWQETLNANIRFEFGRNEWDMPELRTDRIFVFPEGARVGAWAGAPRVYATIHLVLYGTGAKETILPEKSILAAYTYDERFEDIWRRPAEIAIGILDAGWAGVVAPNYSGYADDPRAMRLWQIYRSRWVARFFQEAGINIIPDFVMQRGTEAAAYAGIPKGIETISMETQTATARIMDMGLIRECVQEIKPKTVFFYGIGKGCREVAEKQGCRVVECASWVSARRYDFLHFRKGRVQASVFDRLHWNGPTQARLW